MVLCCYLPGSPSILVLSSCWAVGAETPEGGASDDNEDAEFFDAVDDSPSFITVTTGNRTQHR